MEATRPKHMNRASSSASFKLRSPSLNSLRLRRIFDMFDQNSDGIITVEELSQALNLLGLDSDFKDLQSTIESFVQQGRSGLCYDDFEGLHRFLTDKMFQLEETEGVGGAEDDSDLSEAFKVFDEDGDGYISARELQVVLGKLGLPEARELDRVQQMIVSVDTNNDGRVDFLEFKNMMRRNVLVPSS